MTPRGTIPQNRNAVLADTLTDAQLKRRYKDNLALKEKHLSQIKQLKSDAKDLNRTAAAANAELNKVLKSHNITLNNAQAMHERSMSDLRKKHSQEIAELIAGNDNRISAIKSIHATDMQRKATEIRVLTQKNIANRKSSNTALSMVVIYLVINNI